MSDLTRLRRTFRDDLGDDDAVIEALAGAAAAFSAPPSAATTARHVTAMVMAQLEPVLEVAPAEEELRLGRRFLSTIAGKAAVVSVALVASTSGAAAAGILGDSAKGFVSDVTGGIVAEPADEVESRDVGPGPCDGCELPGEDLDALEPRSEAPPVAAPEDDEDVVAEPLEPEDPGATEQDVDADDPADDDVHALEDEPDATDDVEGRRPAQGLERLDSHRGQRDEDAKERFVHEREDRRQDQ